MSSKAPSYTVSQLLHHAAQALRLARHSVSATEVMVSGEIIALGENSSNFTLWDPEQGTVCDIDIEHHPGGLSLGDQVVVSGALMVQTSPRDGGSSLRFKANRLVANRGPSSSAQGRQQLLMRLRRELPEPQQVSSRCKTALVVADLDPRLVDEFRDSAPPWLDLDVVAVDFGVPRALVEGLLKSAEAVPDVVVLLTNRHGAAGQQVFADLVAAEAMAQVAARVPMILASPASGHGGSIAESLVGFVCDTPSAAAEHLRTVAGKRRRSGGARVATRARKKRRALFGERGMWFLLGIVAAGLFGKF